MWTDKHSRQRIFNYNFPNGFEGVTLMIRGSWLDVSFFLTREKCDTRHLIGSRLFPPACKWKLISLLSSV